MKNNRKYEYGNYVDKYKDKYEKLVFMDLEMNYSKEVPHGEVISIGALKTDNQGKVIDTFYSLIRPQSNTSLSERCMEITKLEQRDLDNSKDFNEVFKEFNYWCGQGKGLFITWSTADARVLKFNDKMGGYRLEIINQIRKNYWDFQKTFSYEYIKRNNVISLDKALKMFNIGFSGKRHNALDDAANLYKVFCMWEKSIDAKMNEQVSNLKERFL